MLSVVVSLCYPYVITFKLCCASLYVLDSSSDVERKMINYSSSKAS